MSGQSATAQARYDAIVDALRGEPGVSLGASAGASNRGFGSTALRIQNRIFAMLTARGAFVVKLPRQRVETLITSGAGDQFDAGGGRVMREWVVVPLNSAVDWLDVATEAMRFVGKVERKGRS